MRWLYRLFADLAGPPVVLAATLKGRFGGAWRERLGLRFYPPPAWPRPRIWFHGASAGEIRSAAAVAEAVLAQAPDTEIFLSAGTPAGLATAGELFSDEPRVTTLAAPLDFWGAPRRALARLRPSALVILETELWPNLLHQARADGVRIMLAAGRLTDRSYRRYRLVRGFMADLLSLFDLLAVAGARERDLYAGLGAPEERLVVLGNPKFDRLPLEAAGQAFADKKADWGEKLGKTADQSLIVAGSTHQGEEDLLLAAFESLRIKRPGLRLILAPRHLNRVSEVLALAEKRGLTAARSSHPARPLLDQAQALVVDTLGHLTALYALADISVVGGSLCPGLTGHNPFEPAISASPTMFGPHMSSFQPETQGLLGVGGARETAPERLAADLEAWLADPASARAVGQAGQAWLATRPAAAPALAEAVLNLVGIFKNPPVFE